MSFLDKINEEMFDENGFITDEAIELCRNWLARRRAWIDQREKQFHDQYPMAGPVLNGLRLENLDAWKFELEIHEWELELLIQSREQA